MNYSKKDYDESAELAIIANRIDKIDYKYVDLITDEIFLRQPFFLSVLLGYQLDTTPEELEEIMKIYFLIWEYFKFNTNVQHKKVTLEYFEEMENNLAQMLKYAEGEPSEFEKNKIYSADLDNLKSKALWVALLYRANNRAVLIKMDQTKRGIIFLGINSFIKCFETI